MKTWIAAAGAIIFLATLGLAAGKAQSDAGQAQIERGKYIVHNVSLCTQCHSPRDAAGNLLTAKILSGGAVPVSTPWPNDAWASVAPSLINMSGYTEDQAVRLLTKGITRRGVPPQRPMPPFAMTEEDAKAVFAYLSTI
jgi:mono/diheme cytochrome c family protein